MASIGGDFRILVRVPAVMWIGWFDMIALDDTFSLFRHKVQKNHNQNVSTKWFESVFCRNVLLRRFYGDSFYYETDGCTKSCAMFIEIYHSFIMRICFRMFLKLNAIGSYTFPFNSL